MFITSSLEESGGREERKSEAGRKGTQRAPSRIFFSGESTANINIPKTFEMPVENKLTKSESGIGGREKNSTVNVTSHLRDKFS